MFGSPLPSLLQDNPLPDPSHAALTTYAAAVRRHLTLIQRATVAAHTAYAQREAKPLPPD